MQAWQATLNGYKSVDWQELGQLSRDVLLLAGFSWPCLAPWPGRLAAALLAPLTRHLRVVAWGLGLFMVLKARLPANSAGGVVAPFVTQPGKSPHRVTAPDLIGLSSHKPVQTQGQGQGSETYPFNGKRIS